MPDITGCTLIAEMVVLFVLSIRVGKSFPVCFASVYNFACLPFIFLGA